MRGQELLNQTRLLRLGIFLALGLWMVMPVRLVAAEQTTVRVLVQDAATGNPIYQAHLTLKYRKPGGFLRRAQVISYSAKTDNKGRCEFPYVPMGEITLMVTASDHESFGKMIDIRKDNQLINVKLRKPRPQL